MVVFGNQSQSPAPPPSPPLYLGLSEMKFYKCVCINIEWFEMHFGLNIILLDEISPNKSYFQQTCAKLTGFLLTHSVTED